MAPPQTRVADFRGHRIARNPCSSSAAAPATGAPSSHFHGPRCRRPHDETTTKETVFLLWSFPSLVFSFSGLFLLWSFPSLVFSFFGLPSSLSPSLRPSAVRSGPRSTGRSCGPRRGRRRCRARRSSGDRPRCARAGEAPEPPRSGNRRPGRRACSPAGELVGPGSSCSSAVKTRPKAKNLPNEWRRVTQPFGAAMSSIVAPPSVSPSETAAPASRLQPWPKPVCSSASIPSIVACPRLRKKKSEPEP